MAADAEDRRHRDRSEHRDPATTQGHYFDTDQSAESDEQLVDVALPDVAFQMATDRGVFSHGRLDTGTAILLRAPLDVPQRGDLLDLGCGAGPIALTLAKRSPAATVWAVDVNERARRLCTANAERNGLSNIRVAAPDEVPDQIEFAAIWSNPPIRIGKANLQALLARWLRRLHDGGRHDDQDSDQHHGRDDGRDDGGGGGAGTAALVVQKHLGADSLQRWLEHHGFHTERVTSKAGFRVFVVRR